MQRRAAAGLSPTPRFSCPPRHQTYFFFLPTILADFFAYSVARYDDLSWGTKAVGSSDAAHDDSGARSTTTRAEKLGAVRRNKARRERTSRTTTWASSLQVVACVILAMVK